MCRKVLAVLLASNVLLLRPASQLPMNHSCTNFRAKPCAKSSHTMTPAADTVTGSEGNRAESRSFAGYANKSLYPAARGNYRPSAAHRPSYRQQLRRYPVHRAQERFQPSEVGYRTPSSQPELQSPSSSSSFMRDKGIKPSELLVADQPAKPETAAPADSYMTAPNSESSEAPDTPPSAANEGRGQESSPEEPTMGQSPPAKESSEYSYLPYQSKYPHYHDSDEKPHHAHSHDYIYVDYDPTLHEHKPDAHYHVYYDHSYHHAPPLNNTYQPMPMESVYGPEENRNRKPYTYYYIGRKLWYIPLYFSVYFIVYLTSLLVKSIARHKIRFPVSYWAGYARALGRNFNRRQLEIITEQITKALAAAGKRYG